MASACPSDDLYRPIFKDGRYNNPFSTWIKPMDSKLNAFKFAFTTPSLTNLPKKSAELDKTLPVLKPDFSQFAKSPDSGVRHMWIGHASSLVQMDGVTFLTDPVFSDRCSPSQWAGTKRYRPPPCTVEELPKVDFVLISHNHYDHLDYNSVKDLNKRFGDQLHWYVPMGMKRWMTDSGIKRVTEMSWWDQELHSKESGVKVVCTPCQHWSKRTLTDDFKALWSSWCVIGPRHRFYFAGDTGYCDAFKQIGKLYGPFDLSTIPIGAYHPRHFLQPQHVDPAQAIDVHIDVRSKHSIGIHWGTFKLSHEFYLEPRELLKEELVKRGINVSSFITVNHGEIRVSSEEPSTSQAANN